VTKWVQRLLIANVIMYFVQQSALNGYQQYALSFVPLLGAIIARPWTIITYMFLHAGLSHILFNMIALYVFGNRVEQRLGPNRFITLYFVSGIAGALLSFLFQNGNIPIVGASGAIFGVMLAYARFWPRDQFLFWGILPVEARWLVAISTLVALFGIGSGVAHFAHLGGFLGGFIYLLYLERRHGAKKFREYASQGPGPDTLANKWQKVNRDSIHEVNRDEVNRILDKISATGLKSLTPQERLFLSNFVPPDDRKPILPS
jgi:membrane associated rhomboid family serine protease